MNLKLNSKIIIITVIPLILSILISIIINVSSMISQGDDRVEKYRQDLTNNIKSNLKSMTEIAVSVFENQYKKENSDESRAVALEMVKNMSYGKNGYFVIQSDNGIMQAHRFAPHLEGKDINKLEDPNGVKITVEVLKITKENGEGFLPYSWPKPGFKEPQPKMSFLKSFKPWKSIIMTGVYIDDIEGKVALEKEKMDSEIRSMILRTVVTGLILIIIIAIITAIIVKNTISKRIYEFVNVIKAVESDVDFSKRSIISGKDEIAESQIAFNHLFDSLQGAISNVSEILNNIANGDFSKQIETENKGDIEVIRSSTNQSVIMLRKLIHDIREVVMQVNSGTDEIARSSQTLASGTSEQAASVEEISSSLGEIGSQTKTNNENAVLARQLSDKMLENIRQGNEHMQLLTTSMDEINDTSSNVTKIIKVIDEIAFQTNLLALNAAVEAARAGKYGKGFAVVAEEVRNLASRSAEAARDTTGLIETSTKKVNEGVSNTVSTAKILSEISDSASKVNDLVGEIATASNEQENAIQEVNTGIHQINTVIQQNASIAEESASSAEELSSLSEELQNMMKRFKLGDKTVSNSPKIKQIIQPKKMSTKNMLIMDGDEFSHS